MMGNAAIMIPQKKSHLVLESDATFLCLETATILLVFGEK